MRIQPLGQGGFQASAKHMANRCIIELVSARAGCGQLAASAIRVMFEAAAGGERGKAVRLGAGARLSEPHGTPPDSSSSDLSLEANLLLLD